MPLSFAHLLKYAILVMFNLLEVDPIPLKGQYSCAIITDGGRCVTMDGTQMKLLWFAVYSDTMVWFLLS